MQQHRRQRPGTTTGSSAHRRGRGAAARRCLVLAAAAGAAGCSTLLSPQIFSDRLLDPPAARASVASSPGPQPAQPAARASLTTAEVIAAAEVLQGKYLVAVKQMSEVTPAISTGLLGLGAWTLYQGITGGSADAIAAAAIGGSTAYLFGSMMVSKPRQRVYLEGARALSCAIGATRPWDLPSDEIGRLPSPARGSLRGDLAIAEKALTSLEAAEFRYRNARASVTEAPAPVEARPRPAACARAGPSCDVGQAPTKDQQVFRERCLAQRRALDAQCAPAPAAAATTLAAHPNTLAAFARANDARSRLQPQIADAVRWLERIDTAGGRLWDQTVEIQIKVGEEVLKTEPDIAAIVGSLGSLRDLASRFAFGGGAFAQGAGSSKAQSAPRGSAPGTQAEALEAIAALDAAVAQADAATAALATWNRRMNARAGDATAGLKECRVITPANTLTVNPEDRELSVAAGASLVFYVSGGTGMPSGTAAGERPGTIERALDEQGRIRFTYRPSQDAVDGDRAAIRFVDATGQAAHSVVVTIRGAGAGGSGPSPKAHDTKDWENLGLKKGSDSDAKFVERVKACKRKKDPTDLSPSAEIDAATRAFMEQESKPCKALP